MEYIFLYIVIFLFFCLEFFLHYKYVNTINPDLTNKQKAYIMSIKSSLTMLLIGLYYNYHYFIAKFDNEQFFKRLDDKGSLDFGKIFILYFTAYLVMDIIIGNYEYKEFLDTLTCYIHHFIYIIINGISLYLGIFPIYFLHMLSELPTLILSMGSFNDNLRDSNIFGLTFFLTRILYMMILMWIFRENKLLLYLCIPILGLHCYWFYNWVKKYYLKIKPKKNY